MWISIDSTKGNDKNYMDFDHSPLVLCYHKYVLTFYHVGICHELLTFPVFLTAIADSIVSTTSS